jgi:hypothetical protein
MELLINGGLIFCGIIVVCILTYCVILYCKILKLEEKVTKNFNEKLNKVNKIILEDKYIDRVNLLMDDFIKQASEVYQIMHLSKNTGQYLKSTDAEHMKRYIYASVKNNMTKDVVNAIKSIYVINSESDLDKILDLRINLYMINFLRQYNDVIDDNVIG